MREPTRNERRVLRTLARAQRPLRTIEIARASRSEQTHVGVYVRRLAELGLVTSRGERTLRTWSPTKAGRALVAPPDPNDQTARAT